MHNQIHLVPPAVAEALVRNDLTEMVRPYRRYIEGWQLRMSYLRAQLATHPAGSDEHDLAERRFAELRGEVEASREYLIAATSRLPPDDRVDTTLGELERLLVLVSTATGARWP